MTLPKTYSLEEVAAALGMSPRWVRDRCKPGGAVHIRAGRKIKFTEEQYEQLRADCTTTSMPQQSITTGRKRRAS